MEFSIRLTFTDVMRGLTIGCVTKFASCQRT